MMLETARRWFQKRFGQPPQAMLQRGGLLCAGPVPEGIEDTLTLELLELEER